MFFSLNIVQHIRYVLNIFLINIIQNKNMQKNIYLCIFNAAQYNGPDILQ